MTEKKNCKWCGKEIYSQQICPECRPHIDRYRAKKYKGFNKVDRSLFSESCRICGKKRELLHHKDIDPTNNDLKNLLEMCVSCHVKIHKMIINPLKKRYGFGN